LGGLANLVKFMTNNSLGGVTGSSSAQGVQLTPKNKNEQIGKDEFLTLLVTQLKNQDPEAPLDSKEFAVQLAQFTQVEKLISIDDKLTAQSDAAAIGSMAGYLGHNVVLDSKEVSVKGGRAGQLQIELTRDSGTMEVQFINSRGALVGKKELAPLNAGKHIVSLDGVSTPDGVYTTRIVAKNRTGAGTFQPAFATVGLVSGFVPGPNPKLIVNGREVSVSAVKEVTVGSTNP
jgi:flagellar basal-body rod modification protein FlgD